MTSENKDGGKRPERERRWMTTLLVALSETSVAVVVVSLFFLIVLGALTMSFPTGTGFRDLYGDLMLPKSEGSGLTLRNITDAAPFSALLSEVRRNVKDRPVDEVAWRYSQQGVSIGDQHAVQTFAQSGAVISFESRGELHLQENSLVVVRRPDDRSDFRRRRAALIVLGGEVEGTLVPVRGSAAVDVFAAGATTQMLARGDGKAQFAVAAHEDGSATLKMFEGSAEVTLSEESVVLEPNHALVITPDEPLGRPVALPGTPALLAPTDGLVETYGTLPPQIRLRWSTIPGADAYSVMVASDPDFQHVVFEEEVRGTELVHGNLDAGDYHWRVAARKEGIEGRAGRVRKFRLVEDLEPPSLQVSLPDAPVLSRELIVSGRTDPGANILIGVDRVTPAGTGEFSYAMTLRPGPNLVVVEAVDAVGNVAYHSQYVNAKF